VHINNTARGLERDLKSNDDGEYLAAALPPGHYDISVTAQGFRRYQANDVTLRVAQNARIDIPCKLAMSPAQSRFRAMAWPR